MSLLDVLEQHFLLQDIVEYLENWDARALLCVSKAATTNIKQQSPTLYKKMQRHGASWGLALGYHNHIYADYGGSQCWYSTLLGLEHISDPRVPRIAASLKFPVSVVAALRCGSFPFLSASDKIPDWSLRDLKRIHRENRPCAGPWYIDHEGEGETWACEACAKFRCALLGLEPECHVAKRLKTQ